MSLHFIRILNIQFGHKIIIMKILSQAALVFLLLIITTTTNGQRILLVDNNPGAPSDDGKVSSFVYNDLPTALTAAIAGDILHIKPSPNSYGNVTITTDDISLVGIGFNPDKDLPITSTVGRIDLNASNVRISGMIADIIDIANQVSVAASRTGIAIDGCQVRSIEALSSDDFADNIIIRNCLLGNNVGISNSVVAINFGAQTSNAIITNNIIVGSIGGSGLGAITASGALIKNNLFLGDGNALRRGFDALTTSTVSNNIFYGRSPESRLTSTTNVFNSNVSIGVATGTGIFPPAGTSNTVDGNNLVDFAVSPSPFTDANIVLEDAWALSWDPALDATNAAAWINSGTDGTNRGVTGSTLGFSSTGTSVPFIKVFNTSEIIKQGTDLPVTIEAQGN